VIDIFEVKMFTPLKAQVEIVDICIVRLCTKCNRQTYAISEIYIIHTSNTRL
jgi:hypothetical protein